MNPLQALAEEGQSIWIDYIRRGMTRAGGLAKLVQADGIRGVTSNPAIFQKAIAGSDDYADALAGLVANPELDAKALYEALAIVDIQEACDALRPVYDDSNRGDGFVSLEVAPGLACDTEGTVAEAKRLWSAVGRPNLMIKVPGTDEGIAALTLLIAGGINVNMTLIFAQSAYQEIAEAYTRGLEQRATSGEDLGAVASVASFFVSRIDSAVDKLLPQDSPLRGKIAVANAKLAYEIYGGFIATDRWQKLAAGGARPQRLLWASTGTKNKAYSDVLYLDELIGRDTVNTVPPATMDAFRDHGKVTPSLTRDVEVAREQLAALAQAGVSLEEVTDELLDKGLDLFADAMDGLLATVAQQQRRAQGGRLNRGSATLPTPLAQAVGEFLGSWNNQRLWDKDASVWTGADEAKWLGWLDIVEEQRKHVEDLHAFGKDVEGFERIVLLGMGGSSLFPDVLARTYGHRGGPELMILDSTVPAQVASVRAAIDPAKTLFIVASKSGSTLEPTVFLEYFLSETRDVLGSKAPQHFVAITDPGSKLEKFAEREGFRRVFHGVAQIGGRFSALSHFGLVPAAAIGMNIGDLLTEAELMVKACRGSNNNPGATLGAILGVAAKTGRDKLTLVVSPAISGFGGWVEQLVAESTGKHGKAIIPVDGELVGYTPYGSDRVFVYLRLRSTPDPAQDAAIAGLRDAGQAVVQLDLDDADALIQEVFRWEFATAVAGAALGINPFDQPDVEASKIASRALTDAFESTGKLPDEPPPPANLVGALREHLATRKPGDYVALLAYIEMNEATEAVLTRVRHRILEAGGHATCLGFGPRFLHSTGQAYKGGPNSGVFIQIMADDAKDVAIPGRRYGFSVIKRAQAAGDFRVLQDRGRRALRVQLGSDVLGGLASLEAALEEALA